MPDMLAGITAIFTTVWH